MALDKDRLRDKLKQEMITAFNLQPGGYDDVYMTKAMGAFAKAIIEEINTNAEVEPIKTVSPEERLQVDVPNASGGGFVTRNVYGKGKIL